MLDTLIAGALGSMAELADRNNKTELARKTYQEAIDLLQKFADYDRTNLQLQGFVAGLRVKLDALDVRLAKYSTTVDLNATVESLKTLLARNSEDTELRYQLALALETRGNREMDDGKYEEAKSSYEEELKLAQGLVNQDPTNISWVWLHAVAFEKNG